MAARTKKKPARKKVPAKKAAKAGRSKKKTTQRVKSKAKPKAKPKSKAKPKAKAKPKSRVKPKAKAAKPKSKAKPGKKPAKASKKAPAARKGAKAKGSPAQLKRERERERLQKAKEALRLKKEREKERQRAQKEKLRAQKEREKQRQRDAKEREREKAQKRKEQDAAKREREAERERARKEREAERAEREAERERLREAARRAKDEERAKRDAEREAYRLAKETEREKLRKDRDAAKRALEGRVAQATKRAQRVAGVGGRGTTTRVYRPDAIPNQAGTRRQASDEEHQKPRARATAIEAPPVPAPAPLPPPPAPVVPDKLDERYAVVRERLEKTPDAFRREYSESLDMSWIYHDSALEGVVYTYQELKTAIDPNITVVPDSSLQPVCEEIRRHKAAIDLARDLGEKKRATINVDLIKKIYLVLHPDDGDLKSVKYRKDIPQHRLYFHEYAAPDKIAYRVRQVADWINGPEPKKIKDPLRIAARAHYDLLRVFPFAQDSGKVARLLMNILLMRAGYPPAIIHSTERQRYYDALKGSLPTILNMMRDAMNNGMASIEKRLDEQESTARGFTTQ